MAQTSKMGLWLAAFGALLLTPDALLMRLSQMNGLQMLGWRGVCTGLVFWAIWLATTRDRRGLRRLASPAGVLLVAAHFSNAVLFPVGIASAPVAIVLIGVAAMPVCAALLSRLVLKEPTSRATWLTILAVTVGVGIAVSGDGPVRVDPRALLGAACGLGVALCLATTFVTLRRNPDLPLLPGLGTGALLAGLVGIAVTTPARMTDGYIPAILATALVILPASFFALSSASRHTQAANVSLLMLLETALGPAWVWAFLHEAPSARALAGGALVLGALAAYLSAPLLSSRSRYLGGSRRRGAAPPGTP